MIIAAINHRSKFQVCQLTNSKQNRAYRIQGTAGADSLNYARGTWHRSTTQLYSQAYIVSDTVRFRTCLSTDIWYLQIQKAYGPNFRYSTYTTDTVRRMCLGTKSGTFRHNSWVRTDPTFYLNCWNRYVCTTWCGSMSGSGLSGGLYK